MNIVGIEIGLAASNCYIAWEAAPQALVIDPGSDAARIREVLTAHGLHPAAYLLTHGHIDHISALKEMHDALPAPIGMHPADQDWAFSSANQMPPYPTPQAPESIERSYAKGQQWTDAGLTYEIIETPGHSPGSVSFYFAAHGVLVTGDALFKGSIGRTDLPGADAPTLHGSLQRIMALPDETRVYPGHGPETAIGQERTTNPFLLDGSWAV